MEVIDIREFRRILRRFQHLTSTQMKACSCSVTLAQCLILLEIEERGQMTMGQLASVLRLDRSTLSRTVEGLVRKKLVTRVRDKGDRRIVQIRLTDQGIAASSEIHKNNDKYCLGVFEHIPESERAHVVHYFNLLAQAYLEYETSLEDS